MQGASAAVLPSDRASLRGMEIARNGMRFGRRENLEPRETRRQFTRADLVLEGSYVGPLPGEMTFHLSVHNQHVPQAIDQFGIIHRRIRLLD